MSTPLKLYLTATGLNTALDVYNQGLTLRLNKIRFGTEHFQPVEEDPHTGMTYIHEADIVATGLESGTHKLLLGINTVTDVDFDVSTIGIYTDNNVLFAIASVPAGNILRFKAGVAFTGSFGMTLRAFMQNTVQVVVEPDSTVALQLMVNHESALNPHPQYLQKINELNQRLEFVEQFTANTIDYFYPVGIIIEFGIPNFNPNNHFEGTTWVRHGEGMAVVGVTTDSSAPTWKKAVGNTFGEDNVTLTLLQTPAHKHSTAPFKNFVARGADVLGTGFVTRESISPQHDNENISEEIATGYFSASGWATMAEKEIGGGQAHNNVQSSIVDARWRRTA